MAIEDAKDFVDPLDDLVERAKLDRGAPFESEVLIQLKEMRRDDRSQFERLIARLKKEAKCNISELKKAISQSGDDEGGQETQASLLVQLAKDQCTFFHDEFGAAYATLSAPHDGGAHRETHKLKSKGFRLWLIRSYYIQHWRGSERHGLQVRDCVAGGVRSVRRSTTRCVRSPGRARRQAVRRPLR